jgi:serine/threonine protein kinase
MSVRAQAPPAPPPDFPTPQVSEGRRTAGHVQVPDPTSENEGPLEMSWKIASAGALMEASPTKLRRTSSIAGNILVKNVEGSSPQKAFWLQRKLTEESHTHNYVRIGFPLQPVMSEEGSVTGAWTVTKADEGGLYPFEMVAIKVQEYRTVFPEEEDCAENGKEGDDNMGEQSNKVGPTRNARNEIAALQMIKEVDPDGRGNVVGAECVVGDEVSVYIVMPYCKEGTLLDMVGASRKNGRLDEADARMYFASILNVRCCVVRSTRTDDNASSAYKPFLSLLRDSKRFKKPRFAIVISRWIPC